MLRRLTRLRLHQQLLLETGLSGKQQRLGSQPQPIVSAQTYSTPAWLCTAYATCLWLVVQQMRTCLCCSETGKSAVCSARAATLFACASLYCDMLCFAVRSRVKMTRLRLRVAERLKGAQNTYAMLTTFNEVDMTGLMEMRSTFKVRAASHATSIVGLSSSLCAQHCVWPLMQPALQLAMGRPTAHDGFHHEPLPAALQCDE